MIEQLDRAPRLVLRSFLEPVAGSAFQPTGFPDLGAAEFERPGEDGGPPTRALLVESVQSLANHLEAVGWNAPERAPHPALAALPYMEVRDPEDRFLSSSRLEPHRLAGAYVKDATIEGEAVEQWMIGRFAVEKGKPLDWQSVYRAIFDLDPLCLVHGVFFSDPDWGDYGNPKVRRAITALIEAYGVRPLVSGGVKRDDVRPTVDKGEGGHDATGGYGFVPFGRTEYTAERIELVASIDLEQIRGYGLGDDRSRLLTLVALWELTSLLDGGLRLRTACDLEPVLTEVRRPEGFVLPSPAELEAEISGLNVDFEHRGARTVVWK